MYIEQDKASVKSFSQRTHSQPVPLTVSFQIKYSGSPNPSSEAKKSAAAIHINDKILSLHHAPACKTLTFYIHAKSKGHVLLAASLVRQSLKVTFSAAR